MSVVKHRVPRPRKTVRAAILEADAVIEAHHKRALARLPELLAPGRIFEVADWEELTRLADARAAFGQHEWMDPDGAILGTVPTVGTALALIRAETERRSGVANDLALDRAAFHGELEPRPTRWSLVGRALQRIGVGLVGLGVAGALVYVAWVVLALPLTCC